MAGEREGDDAPAAPVPLSAADDPDAGADADANAEAEAEADAEADADGAATGGPDGTAAATEGEVLVIGATEAAAADAAAADGGSAADETDHNGCLSRITARAEQSVQSHEWFRAQTLDLTAKHSGFGAVFKNLFIGRFIFVLHAINSVPEPYAFNPHIRSGYRVSLRKRDCMRSLYRGLHNETGNIYTHLLGSLLFVYLFISCWSWLHNVHVVHYGMFALYLASALQCLLCSTVYHTFGCHCVCTFEKLLSLDYSGIGFLICGSQIPIIFYLFLDDLTTMAQHMTGIIAVTFASHVLTHAHRFKSEGYMWLRICSFVSNALYASPVMLWVLWRRLRAAAELSADPQVLNSVWAILSAPTAPGDVATARLWDVMYYVSWMYAFYGIGIVFYSSKFPERLSPGTFDFWCHSHQIWHIFVVAAALSQFYAVVSVFLYAGAVRPGAIPLIDPNAGSPFLNPF